MCIYTYISTHVCIYIYIYICMITIYIYIYIYMWGSSVSVPAAKHALLRTEPIRKYMQSGRKRYCILYYKQYAISLYNIQDIVYCR